MPPPASGLPLTATVIPAQAVRRHLLLALEKQTDTRPFLIVTSKEVRALGFSNSASSAPVRIAVTDQPTVCADFGCLRRASRPQTTVRPPGERAISAAPRVLYQTICAHDQPARASLCIFYRCRRSSSLKLHREPPAPRSIAGRLSGRHNAVHPERGRQGDSQALGAQAIQQNPGCRRRQALRRLPEPFQMDLHRGAGCCRPGQRPGWQHILAQDGGHIGELPWSTRQPCHAPR